MLMLHKFATPESRETCSGPSKRSWLLILFALMEAALRHTLDGHAEYRHFQSPIQILIAATSFRLALAGNTQQTRCTFCKGVVLTRLSFFSLSHAYVTTRIVDWSTDCTIHAFNIISCAIVPSTRDSRDGRTRFLNGRASAVRA